MCATIGQVLWRLSLILPVLPVAGCNTSAPIQQVPGRSGGNTGDSGTPAPTGSGGLGVDCHPARGEDSGTTATDPGSTYSIGVGMYDITGPSAEIGLMGFADDTQKGAGISMRLRSRAFVVGDENKRVVFVNVDTWAISQMVKLHVGQKLAADPELGKFYNMDNVCISATHTHSAVAGFDGYYLYDQVPGGFSQSSFDAVVNGIVQSIALAHKNCEPGKIYVTQGHVDKCGWNRSPRMYENNPADERAAYDGNTDKTMTLLKLVNLKGEDLGMINWYAVHPTSIGPKNHLVSGDNKGHAEYMFEKDMGTDYQAAKTFVAAFAQANAGDVTPNVPFTKQFGTIETAMEAADIDHDTAERLGLPWPEALGEADIEQNIELKLMARRQYAEARRLYDSATEAVSGSIDFRHEWVDMRALQVTSAGATTCAGGMGASYSYGSPADNPSPYPLFKEGVTTTNTDLTRDPGTALMSILLPGATGVISPASLTPAYKACQAPKPVILATGLMSFSAKQTPLTPQIVPLQVLKIGSLAVAAVPTEVTTMAGRRIKKTLIDGLGKAGVKYSAVASLANTYASYLATKEEYQLQGYEGAGTFFGPNQLLAFQQEYGRMCAAIAAGTPVESGPIPSDITADASELSAGQVAYDNKHAGVEFGSVDTEPADSYKKGDIVSVVFWGGHPNNDLMTQGTYLEVEKLSTDGKPAVVARDGDPDTKFIWKREGSAVSKITVLWNTKNAEPGTYRIHHYGHWKAKQSKQITAYEGLSKSFSLQ